MSSDCEIIDLSGLNNLQILEGVEKLLQQNEFQKFTVLVTRKLNTRSSIMPKTKMRTKYSSHLYNKCMSELSLKHPSPSSETYNDQFDTPLQKALRLYQQQMFQQALQMLVIEQKELIESLKGGAERVKMYQDVCFHIGNCYYRLKQIDKAIEWFTKTFQGQELRQQGQKLNNLGSCYAQLDQPRLSLKSYGEALKIYSSFPQKDCSNLLNNLGMLYTKSNMFETAQKYFLQSIEERKAKSPHNSHLLYSSYLHLGNCQKHAKKYTEAVTSLNQALSFAKMGFGNEAETLMELAGIHQLCEKWRDALDCYQRLSTKAEKKAFLFERAAQIHRQMGAQNDYQRFIVKAYEEYKFQNNERKVSQLSTAVLRIKNK